jgi:hypothetical protein
MAKKTKRPDTTDASALADFHKDRAYNDLDRLDMTGIRRVAAAKGVTLPKGIKKAAAIKKILGRD